MTEKEKPAETKTEFRCNKCNREFFSEQQKRHYSQGQICSGEITRIEWVSKQTYGVLEDSLELCRRIAKLCDSNLQKAKINLKELRGKIEHKYPVVCICGSTRFEKETIAMAENLTLAGQIVLMVNCWSRKDALHEPQNSLDEEIKTMFDDLHKEKIKLADYILVMNIGGYIGKSTQSEIDFAQRIGKSVKFLEPLLEVPEK